MHACMQPVFLNKICACLLQGKMVTTNVRASALADGSEAFMHYMIDVQSLKVGGHELLQFKDKSIAIQAILDSGTSCLVVPDDTFDLPNTRALTQHVWLVEQGI